MPSSSTLGESVSVQIRIELARQNVSQSELARRCGWIPQYLHRRMAGEVPWTLEELQRVAKELGIDPQQFVWPAAS